MESILMVYRADNNTTSVVIDGVKQKPLEGNKVKETIEKYFKPKSVLFESLSDALRPEPAFYRKGDN